MPSENDCQAQSRQTQANQTQASRAQLKHTRGAQARRVPATAAQAEQVQVLWRARALRYVLIYLLMGSALVTLRYQTREVYPQLHTLRVTRTELQRQQKELSVSVQTLTGEQRVREWAIANGMVPYAQASKQTQAFGPPVAPPMPDVSQSSVSQSSVSQSPASQSPPMTPLTVRTVWR